MLDRIAALPGVVAAGFASNVPLDGMPNNAPMAIEGVTLAPGETARTRRQIQVSPGYFEAMGTRLVAGRDVTWSDIETGGRVVLVSEDFARELATDAAGALGKRVRLAPFADDEWKEIVGVVQSVHHDGPHRAAPSAVYWPVLARNKYGRAASGWPWPVFAIRTERAESASLLSEIRQAVRSVGPSIPVAQERTMRDYYADSLARTSFTLTLLAVAGAMALALGVVGIYGVIAYVVSQRAREVGIRSALGAEPRQLERMFLRHGLTLSAAGIVLGLVAAAGLSRAVSSLLFGIEPTDPAAYAVAIAVIIAAAGLASYLPARRAARIDPIETLRAE
jgi:predicted permease